MDPKESSVEALEEHWTGLRKACQELLQDLDSQLIGQLSATRLIFEALLAGGHGLLEGAPGLGKTTLVRLLAEHLQLTFRRIQFTPDLMPADILGARLLQFDERGAQGLEFEPGPILTQVLLADEINRATPRTQSALLEAMEERQVTVYGETMVLEEPFMVIATQNPIEMEGTFPLPEAQLDRFMIKVEVELPDVQQLANLLLLHSQPKGENQRVSLDREQVLAMRSIVEQIVVGEDVAQRVGRLIHATHPTSPLAGPRTKALVRHGSSPRGGLALLAMARARQFLSGGRYVPMEDIESLAVPCLRHRLLLNFEGQASETTLEELVQEALEQSRNEIQS